MPIYMDRHELPHDITPEKLSELHQKDLDIEHKHNCKGFTYWLDLDQKYAFCLIQAPDREAVFNLHKESHGDLPTTIIEVEPNIVETFLGRMSDPETDSPGKLPKINDPAYRILMMLNLKHLNNLNSFKNDSGFKSHFKLKIEKLVKENEGVITSANATEILACFKNAKKAIKTAEIISLEKQANNFHDNAFTIGIVSGYPVTPDTNSFFEEAISHLKRVCTFVKAPIIINSELRATYHQEEGPKRKALKNAYILTPDDEKFIKKVCKFIDANWQDPKLNMDRFSQDMGLSKSQLYRNIMRLTEKPPNAFIRNYRLSQALERIKTQNGNISEIAFEAGFNSVGYFSKQFKNAFGVLPSNYSKSLK
ncbi:nickel-binding protein [Gaetbulibacter aestuarii]|uniref:Nickel-binding protein n=1 Tax=Gaetbulibacter aestuarii TaxID=1502358 RepID=A0ABW7MWG2_9FLAO